MLLVQQCPCLPGVQGTTQAGLRGRGTAALEAALTEGTLEPGLTEGTLEPGIPTDLTRTVLPALTTDPWCRLKPQSK